MANDNLLAIIAGVAGGAEKVAVPFFQARQKYEYESALQKQKSDEEAAQYKLRVPWEIDKARQIDENKTNQNIREKSVTGPMETTEKNKQEQFKQDNSVPIIVNGKVTGYAKEGGYNVTDKATTADKKDQASLDRAKSAFATLEKLHGDFGKTPSGPEALISRAASKVSGGKYGSRGQRTYEDSLNSNSVKFYRDFTGDTRLSDADARDRAYKLLPDAYFDKGQGTDKFMNLKQQVLINVRPTLEKLGINEDDFLRDASNMAKGLDRPLAGAKADWSDSEEARYQELLKKQAGAGK